MINTTSMMTNEQYRNYLIDSIHIAAQMMYNMAEDLAAYRSDEEAKRNVINAWNRRKEKK